MAEIEYAGVKVGGSKLLLVIPLIGSIIGGLWGGFEFYKDYTDMREVVQNIDVDAIAARNDVMETKLDEAIEYTRDIKSGLRDDILRIEKQADRAEDKVRASEEKVREMIDSASERFETKRDALSSDTSREIKELEERLEKKLQRALDNPLSDT